MTNLVIEPAVLAGIDQILLSAEPILLKEEQVVDAREVARKEAKERKQKAEKKQRELRVKEKTDCLVLVRQALANLIALGSHERIQAFVERVSPLDIYRIYHKDPGEIGCPNRDLYLKISLTSSSIMMVVVAENREYGICVPYDSSLDDCEILLLSYDPELAADMDEPVRVLPYTLSRQKEPPFDFQVRLDSEGQSTFFEPARVINDLLLEWADPVELQKYVMYQLNKLDRR